MARFTKRTCMHRVEVRGKGTALRCYPKRQDLHANGREAKVPH